MIKHFTKKVYIKVSKGALSIPLLMSMSEPFSAPFYFNKTLPHTQTQSRNKTTCFHQSTLNSQLATINIAVLTQFGL